MVPGKGNRTQACAELEASLTISGVTCWLTVERRSGRRAGQVVGDQAGQSLAGHERELGVYLEWDGRPLGDIK